MKKGKNCIYHKEAYSFLRENKNKTVQRENDIQFNKENQQKNCNLGICLNVLAKQIIEISVDFNDG